MIPLVKGDFDSENPPDLYTESRKSSPLKFAPFSAINRSNGCTSLESVVIAFMMIFLLDLSLPPVASAISLRDRGCPNVIRIANLPDSFASGQRV